HRNTIGRFVRPRLQPNSRMDVEWEDTDFGGRTFAIIDNDRSIDPGRLEFYRPNIMVLHIPMPKQTFRMHAICVPVAAQKVRMIVVGARSFAKLSLLNPLFNYSNKRIVAEDRAVVESSDPPVVPPAAQEVSVRSDRATLAFRKYYFQSLHTSSVSVKRGLPVVTDSPV
ncbi:MAG TPA: aromatic ring-hydroxylating dioxygenase subunit alpha, partial [Pseudomonadota bacterium]|nr:aromatic ring-hydroxylating dioxygenase subunit alpha [Pseudomonadota bacterium]